MPKPVVSGASLMCTMGMTPGTLNVLPVNRVMFENKPVATVQDKVPFLNVMPFGLCNSLTNPITATQTAAALGVLTPGTCTPVIPGPWLPGAIKTKVANQAALTDASTCMCAYGGQIKVTVGQAFREDIT